MLFTNQNAHYDSSASSFGTLSFKSLCHQKVYLVSQLLEAGVNVLWTDNDIVWLADPIPLMLQAERDLRSSTVAVECWQNYEMKCRRAAEAPTTPIGLFVQCDDDGLCAGFFLIRSNVETIQYLSKVMHMCVCVCFDTHSHDNNI